MADPFTIAAIGMGASAAGAGVSAFGAMQQGEAQAGMYGYQAGVAQLNKKIALQNRDYALESGEVEAQRSGLQTRATAGKIKVAQGASGLGVNSGSAPLVRSSQELVGQEDEGIIRSNAARRAYGFETEAINQEAQSNIYKMSGENAKTSGKINAISSILGGVASVSGKWLQGSSVGLYGGGGQDPNIFGPSSEWRSY